MVFNSAMLFLLLLVASASGGQAERSYLKGEDPSSSFRVLDRINTILEKELNMLDGGSQVALRGTMDNAMSFAGKGSYFPATKAKMRAAWTKMKTVAGKKAKWIRGKINSHPYAWMAFKVASTVVTAVFCPACAVILGAAFAVADITRELANLKEAADQLGPMSGEAKATCLSAQGAKTLLVVVAAGVNVFVPIPLDVAQLAGAAAGAFLGSIDWGSILGAGGNAVAAGATDSVFDGIAAGAVGEKANKLADNAIENDKKSEEMVNELKKIPGAKMGKCDCSKIPDDTDASVADTQLEGTGSDAAVGGGGR